MLHQCSNKNFTSAKGLKSDLFDIIFALQLVKLLQKARNVSVGVPNQGGEEGGLMHDMEEDLLSKCALFVFNKWDSVPEKEIQSVKDGGIKKLRKIWPGIDPESQVTYMSTTNAATAQNLDVISNEFSLLMDGMRSVIMTTIEAKLELHWK